MLDRGEEDRTTMRRRSGTIAQRRRMSAEEVSRIQPGGADGPDSATTTADTAQPEGSEDELVASPVMGSRADSHRFTREAAFRLVRGGVPPPLRGSLELLQRQNDRLQADGLERILDEADLSARIQHKLLVPVPVSSGLTVNQNLPENHRYVRPWTAQFLSDLARAHLALFHRPLEVSSAVRPVSYQERLARTNGNAAPAEGDIISPHIMGATIDIAKHGLTYREIGWLRRSLATLEDAGVLDVEEEFRQSCFHITVYKSYDQRMKAAAPAEARGTRSRTPATEPAAPAREAEPAGASTGD
jgi:Family of unknown function (DUF5715)